VVICLERCANNLHMVQLMPLPPQHLFIKIQIGLTFLLLAYPGYSGKEAVKRMSVSLCWFVSIDVTKSVQELAEPVPACRRCCDDADSVIRFPTFSTENVHVALVCDWTTVMPCWLVFQLPHWHRFSESMLWHILFWISSRMTVWLRLSKSCTGYQSQRRSSTNCAC